MRRIPAPVAFILVVVLAACAPDAQPTLHDVYVYGHEGRDVRHSYFYGNPTTFALDDRTVTLEDGTSASPLAVQNALLVDGQAVLTTSVDAIPAPFGVVRIPLTTMLQVRTSAALEDVVYFDGSAWLTLFDEAESGWSRRVAPRPRIGALRGVGALTPLEADALSGLLAESGQPLIVAALPDDDVPERTIDGLAEYRATALYVQNDVPVDPNTLSTPADEVVWDVIAQGNQAVGFDAPAFRLVTDEVVLLELWNRAYGSSLEVPPVPSVDFSRETVVAVFQGDKPTGGYGIEVLAAAIEAGELFVDMRFSEPDPGAITTQALTSPWIFVRVLRGGIGTAWFRDPATGELLGVARDVQ